MGKHRGRLHGNVQGPTQSNTSLYQPQFTDHQDRCMRVTIIWNSSVVSSFHNNYAKRAFRHSTASAVWNSLLGKYSLQAQGSHYETVFNMFSVQ